MSLDEAVELTKELVAINTANGDPVFNMARAMEFVRGVLRSNRFDVNLDRYGDENQLNLYAQVGSGNPRLVLNAHLDTVPLDPDKWDIGFEPLQAKVFEDSLYGRGSVDMKGPLAAMLVAAKRYVEGVGSDAASLGFLITSGEEIGLTGVRNLSDELRSTVDDAFWVVGEPTDLRLVNATKGNLYYSITFRGKGGHSSISAPSDNVVYAASEVALAIKDLNGFYIQEAGHPWFGAARPTIVVTGLQAYEAANVVPSECGLIVNFRYLCEEDVDLFRRSVEAVFGECKGKYPGVEISYEAVGNVPPMRTPLASEIVVELSELLGVEPTYASYTQDGVFGPTGKVVVFGPGSIDKAHKPMEHIRLGDLERGIEAYRKIIHHFCS